MGPLATGKPALKTMSRNSPIDSAAAVLAKSLSRSLVEERTHQNNESDSGR
jgi:hypothetical protein